MRSLSGPMKCPERCPRCRFLSWRICLHGTLKELLLGEVCLEYRWEERWVGVWGAKRAGLLWGGGAVLHQHAPPPPTLLSQSVFYCSVLGWRESVVCVRASASPFLGQADQSWSTWSPSSLVRAPLCCCQEVGGALGSWSEPSLQNTPLTSETNYKFGGIPQPPPLQ